MSDAPVVVVGAGPVGLSAAWSLAREGAEVTVLDANAEIGQDTASGSAGALTPSHCVPLAGPRVLRLLPSMLLRRGMITIRLRPEPALARFGLLSVRAGRGEQMLAGLRALRDQARASLELYADLAAGRPALEFRRVGLINVCSTAKGFAELREEADLLAHEGFEPQLFEGAATAELEPSLREDVAGGVLWQEDANLVPGEAIAAIAAAAREAGARIELGTPVSGFRRDAGGAVAEVLLGGRSQPARAVVLAAGSGTPALARQLGARVPIQPGKGHHLHLAQWRARPRIPMIFHEHAMGATAMGEGMRLTGGMDFAGFDRRLDPGRVDDILRLAGDYLRESPSPADAASAAQWCGLRPCSPDGLPMVGWMRRSPNVVLAAGHGMMGLSLAPATGNDVADLILGRTRPEATWQRQYSPARFGV